MIYNFLEKIVTRSEFRAFNHQTDIDPSDGHTFNYEFTLPYIKNKKVLDVGCWSGQYTKLALKDVKEIIGINPEKGPIDYAKKHIKGATFLVGSVLELPFKDSTFDTVIYMDVLEHIPKGTEIQSLKEINRVLKPDGTVIMSTCYKHLIAVLLDPAFWAFGHRHYSKEELSDYFLKSNFKVEKIHYIGKYWMQFAFIYSMFNKYILRRKWVIPSKMKERILNEYRSNKGIVGIYYVATKRK